MLVETGPTRTRDPTTVVATCVRAVMQFPAAPTAILLTRRITDHRFPDDAGMSRARCPETRASRSVSPSVSRLAWSHSHPRHSVAKPGSRQGVRRARAEPCACRRWNRSRKPIATEAPCATLCRSRTEDRTRRETWHTRLVDLGIPKRPRSILAASSPSPHQPSSSP